MYFLPNLWIFAFQLLLIPEKDVHNRTFKSETSKMNVLKLTSGREISYLNEVEIRMGIDERNGEERYKNELENMGISDITVHKYEGGFKV